MGWIAREIGRRLQIEHRVEHVLAAAIGALEIDGSNRTAGNDAVAMRLAFIEVDLIAPVDRGFGAGVDACVATCTCLEVDRILLLPSNREIAEPAAEVFERAAGDGVIAVDRELRRSCRSCQKRGDGQPILEQLGPAECSVGVTDDQQPPFGLVGDAGDRRRIGKGGRGQQCRNLRRRRRGFS